MTEEQIAEIIERYETDREFKISEAYPDGGIDPLFRRLSRTALNQISNGPATISGQ